MEEVFGLLDQFGPYFIATVEGDQPRVRPFGSHFMHDGRIYIQTQKDKNVGKQLIANPKIEMCAMKERDVLRIQALAIAEDRPEVLQAILEANPAMRERVGSDLDSQLILYLKDAVATISQAGETKVIEF
ncbi:MAG: pyridoxamine 5'-phosphate oxidase family protein [Coriobacteriia bacterium]|nr:pyridoxamine 5'-phosphate oxidase family protein [Coriobacteriia bacterium]